MTARTMPASNISTRTMPTGTMVALAAPRQGWRIMAGAAALLGALPPVPLAAQLALSVPAVAVFGLPHGATDWWLAAERLPGRLPTAWRRLWAPLFGLAYLAVAALAAGAILLAPAASLLAFIALAAWHFGAVDAVALRLPPTLPATLGVGLLPIGAPALFHPHAVATLTACLGVKLPEAALAVMGAASVALALLLGWFYLAIAPAPASQQRRHALLAEQAACLLLMAAAPPLFGFLVYFCLIHAPRQAAALDVRGNKLIVWASAGLAAVMIGAAVFAGVPASALAAQLPPRGVQALFWGLAVLSFPHVLCGWLLRSRPDRPPPGHPPPAPGTSGPLCKDAAPW